MARINVPGDWRNISRAFLKAGLSTQRVSNAPNSRPVKSVGMDEKSRVNVIYLITRYSSRFDWYLGLIFLALF